nr:hypothetical protein [Tanacetum cinerariifolium]
MTPRAELSFVGLDNSVFKSKGNPQHALQDQWIFYSGCSIHMTENKSYLTDYQEINGAFVAFRGNAKRGKITGKGLKSSKYEVADDAGKKSTKVLRNENGVQDPAKERKERAQRNEFESISIPVNAATLSNFDLLTDPFMPDLEDTADLKDTRIFSGTYDDDDIEGAMADFNNLELTIVVSPIPTTRIHKDHPKDQIIWDPLSALQTRRMAKTSQEHAMVTYIKKQRRTNYKAYQNYLFACFLSQIEHKKVIQALIDPSWIEAMQDELLQFRLQKSTFLYGTIDEEVYVCQSPSFEDSHFPNKVEKALYGLHQAPKAWYKTLSTYLLENRFRRGIIDKTLFINKDKGDIMLVQVYVDNIIFGSTKKSLCIEFEGLMHKKFQMSSMGELTFFLGLQVMHRDDRTFISQESISMIGSLMYLTTSRPDIMFVVCAYARFQVTPKVLHIHVLKRIFRYLKSQSKLGLWYPRDSPFDLEAFSYSDYARASLDRKSTTR